MFGEHHSLCHGWLLNVELTNPSFLVTDCIAFEKTILPIFSSDYFDAVKKPEI